MPVDLPVDFAENLNHLGLLIRFTEGVRREDLRREYLRTGMSVACSLLTDLEKLRNGLSSDFDKLDSSVAEASKLVTDNQKMFLKLEKLILMDFGINEITRCIMLNNLKRVAAHKSIEGRVFDDSDIVGALSNLRKELCERSDEFDRGPKGMAKLVERTITYAVAPINIAVSVFHPALLPLVFKGSGWAATVASKVAAWQ